MTRLLRVVLVACLAAVFSGCPSDPPPAGSDASTPGLDATTPKPDASSCQNGQTACGTDCCEATEACVNNVCKAKPADCGNNAINGTEQCDGTNLNSKTCVTEGYASGNVTCNADCTLNTSACVAAANCGNGTIDGTEQCDKTNLNGKTCVTEGYATGDVTCKANCTLDTSACVAAASCGNGTIDGTEQCDKTNLNGKTCVTEGYASGDVTCKANCTLDTSACVAAANCGNGTIDGTEQCDKTNLNGKTCVTEGYASGDVTCKANCTLDTSACVAAASCGNGTIDGTEQCDKTNLNNKTCVTEGYASGNVTCKSNCTLDTSACVAAASCGNGTIDGTEQCDKTNLNGKTCVTEGYASGNVTCKTNCTLDTSACVPAANCGNGTIDGTEQCDKANLNSKTCVDLGFTSGTLACNNNCTFNTAACVGSVGCTANQTECGSACCDNGSETCVDDVCIGSNPTGCLASATYGTVSIQDEAFLGEQDPDPSQFQSVMGPLPASDGTADFLRVELYAGAGVFSGGFAPGTYQLTGDETNYATCGLCVRILADVDDSTGDVGAFYMATGGTVELTAVGAAGFTAKLTNVTFVHVDIDSQYNSTPNPDGCASSMAHADVVATIPVACDPVNPTACGTGEGCYFDGSTGFVCATAGTIAEHDACLDSTGNSLGQCVPGTQCFSDDGTCHAYCDPTVTGACTAPESCVELTDGIGGCLPVETNCADTLDDDSDGTTDCDDTDCQSQQVCWPTATEVEPNNTIATANPYVDPFVGGITPSADVDYVSVVVTVKSNLVAETKDSGNGACTGNLIDSIVEAFDAAGTSLGKNDDGGEGYCSLLTLKGLAPGTYYIKVAASSYAKPPLDVFPYNLSITLTPAEICDNTTDDDNDGNADCKDSDCQAETVCIEVNCNDTLDNDADGMTDCADDQCALDSHCMVGLTEVEPNDTFATANDFVDPFVGTINPVGDEDWIKIVVAVGGKVSIEVTDRGTDACANGDLDSNLEVYDSTGTNMLDENDDIDMWGGNFCSRVTLSGLAAGTYYARVQASSYANPKVFAYGLAVTEGCAAPTTYGTVTPLNSSAESGTGAVAGVFGLNTDPDRLMIRALRWRRGVRQRDCPAGHVCAFG
ncbi:MAG: PPC domain-containing protein [Myxococcales bacterium]